MINKNEKAPCDKRALLSNLISNSSIVQTGRIANCLQFSVRCQGWLYQVLIPKQGEPTRGKFATDISDKDLAAKFITDKLCLQSLYLDSSDDISWYKSLLETMVVMVKEVRS